MKLGNFILITIIIIGYCLMWYKSIKQLKDINKKDYLNIERDLHPLFATFLIINFVIITIGLGAFICYLFSLAINYLNQFTIL